jgi:hypothetical protein
MVDEKRLKTELDLMMISRRRVDPVLDRKYLYDQTMLMGLSVIMIPTNLGHVIGVHGNS